jgi:protein TonB
VDVVVLSADVELFAAIRDAVGERNPVWRARSAEEAVELLITGRCGVLLIDLGSVATRPDALVQQILGQFPDVVVCVAGRRDDEPGLASLITEGHVYRFMHKPLSPRRAGMFLQAAIRHHCERRPDPRLPSLVPDNVVALPSRFEPLKWVFVAVGVALFVMLLSIFVDGRPADAPVTTAAAPPQAPTQARPATVAVQANPVLSRARAAFDAGRYESPPGRNALDLYKAVVLAQPDSFEARTGLDRTLDRILVNARAALDAGNAPEAQRLVGRVLEADPDRPAAIALSQQLRENSEPKTAIAAAAPVPVAAPVTPAATTVPAPAPLTRPPSTQVPPSLAAAQPTPATHLTNPVSKPVVPAPSRSLPGPVTQLPPIDAPAATETAAPAPIVVRPDPLTARVVNASSVAPREPRPRIYARKVDSLPIAGYVKSSEPQPGTNVAAATDSAPPSSDAPVAAPSGPVLPADSFEKLVVTDPVYPLEALRSRTQGWVQLEFTITPSGAVRDISVVEGEPRGVFDRSAADALARWRFKPRYVNGQPTAQRSMVVMRFNLEG